MSDDKSEPETPATEQEPVPEITSDGPERGCRGHLTPAGREQARAEIARLVTSGEAATIQSLAERLHLSRPTIRALLSSLGLIGGASNQHKTAGVTLRAQPTETKRGRRARLAREAVERAQARKAIDKLERQRAKSERQGVNPGQPIDLSPPLPPPKPPAQRRTNAGQPKARILGAPSVAPPPAPPESGPPPSGPDIPPDLLGRWITPDGFDEVERLRKMASAPWIDPSHQIAALRLLVGIKGGRGKIDWATFTVDQIPEEMRHRLAGMLLPWIDFAELPEVVRSAPLVCRQVYKLTGVLPQRAEDAEVVLERWAVTRQELRDLAGEVRLPEAGKAPPLDLDLAAETAYIPPQWEDGAGN